MRLSTRSVPARWIPTILLLAWSIGSAPAAGQYTLSLPSGDSLRFGEPRLREMLEESRRLRTILEEDPEVLYYMGSGPEVSAASPAPSYPWNAVRVVNDSVARVATPANYREAERAYVNYAVEKMRLVREVPPAASCDTAVARETRLVGAWIDGWILARTLYGGPPLPPLDALAFAREAEHLSPLLVRLGDTELGTCAESWSRSHPEAMEAFEAWYRERELGAGSAAGGS